MFLREAIPALFSDRNKFQSEIEQTLTMARKVTSKSIQEATRLMMERLDHSEMVIGLGSNIMIIQGEKDGSTPLEIMLEKGKEVQKEVVLNSGHMCQF